MRKSVRSYTGIASYSLHHTVGPDFLFIMGKQLTQSKWAFFRNFERWCSWKTVTPPTSMICRILNAATSVFTASDVRTNLDSVVFSYSFSMLIADNLAIK